MYEKKILTPEELNNLIEKSGMQRKSIAEQMGVSRQTLNDWLKELTLDRQNKILQIISPILNRLNDKKESYGNFAYYPVLKDLKLPGNALMQEDNVIDLFPHSGHKVKLTEHYYYECDTDIEITDKTTLKKGDMLFMARNLSIFDGDIVCVALVNRTLYGEYFQNNGSVILKTKNRPDITVNKKEIINLFQIKNSYRMIF